MSNTNLCSIEFKIQCLHDAIRKLVQLSCELYRDGNLIGAEIVDSAISHLQMPENYKITGSFYSSVRNWDLSRTNA